MLSQTPGIYCQAVLPHAGLGNRLFPWARCHLFSVSNHVPMLSPNWAQLSVGPFLRREADPRIYHGLFNSKAEHIQGIRKLQLQLQAEKRPEPDSLVLNAQFLSRGKRPVLFTFEGWKDYFARLNGWHSILYSEIARITKERWLRDLSRFNDIPIGLHVRRGDFAEPSRLEDFQNQGRLRTPLTWFIESLRIVRAELGFSAKAYVVSDGQLGELQEVLNKENVAIVKTGSAIADLLILSRARILIASGGSTFSAWAAFLGQMPAITYPGQPLSWYKLANSQDIYMGEFDPLAPSPQFLRQLKGALGR